MRRLAAERGLRFDSYEELWRWSVSDLEGFWSAVWDFYDVHSTPPYERVLSARSMPGAVWFPGSRVNYAEHLLRHEAVARRARRRWCTPRRLRPPAEMSWHDLGAAVRVAGDAAARARRAARRSRRGLHAEHPRDRRRDDRDHRDRRGVVVGGARVRRANRDRPFRADRADGAVRRRRLPFRRQGLRPRATKCARSGRAADRERVVWLPYLDPATPPLDGRARLGRADGPPPVARERSRTSASPTTTRCGCCSPRARPGCPRPSCTATSASLVEHLKRMGFHLDLRPAIALFFYTTTGWMMFNTLLSSLLRAPRRALRRPPGLSRTPALLWRLAADARATSSAPARPSCR